MIENRKMSYRYRGGGRRNYRGEIPQKQRYERYMNGSLPSDDLDDRIGREVYETPEERLKNLIIRFGEAVRTMESQS